MKVERNFNIQHAEQSVQAYFYKLKRPVVGGALIIGKPKWNYGHTEE